MKACKIIPESNRTWLSGATGIRGLSSGLSIILLLVFLVAASCATHGKHRKIKAVPCPCETGGRK